MWFFQRKNYGDNKNPFRALCEKIRPLALNYPNNFCAGVGPLKLIVVFVCLFSLYVCLPPYLHSCLFAARLPAKTYIPFYNVHTEMVSWRLPNFGTYYIQAVCHVIAQSAHDTYWVDMMTEVNIQTLQVLPRHVCGRKGGVI